MSLAKDVIIMWGGSAASIPAGFTRVTDLDGKFPKGWGTQNPNVTGGSDNHSHTSPAHTHVINAHVHYLTTNSAWEQDGNYEDNGHPDNNHGAHDHHFHNGNFSNRANPTGNLVNTITYQADTNNSRPPYKEVIYIKPTSWTSIPNNGIVLWASASVPDNFHICDGLDGTIDLRNKYPRGADTGQDAGATGGTLYHTHNISHTHSAVSHVHYVRTVGNDNNDHLDLANTSQRHASGNHNHDFTSTSTTLYSNAYNATYTSAAAIEPEYKKLLAIQNISGANRMKKSVIAMWLGNADDIPVGWELCNGQNGTPDMRDKFLKIANDTSEINNIGGANTHIHPASNSHTHTATGSHTHPANQVFGSETDPGYGTGVGSDHLARHGHNHKVLSYGSATASWGNATVQADSSDSQPPYRTLVFIRYKFTPANGLLMAFV